MAITAELAKKCGALTDKAYPLRVPGNPAAGREYGTAKKVRDCFNKCVANGGNIAIFAESLIEFPLLSPLPTFKSRIYL